MAEEFTLEQLLGGEVADSCHRVRIKGVISQLPPLAVSNVRSVEMLDVSGSCLEDFPQNFSELRRLKILFASSNSFSCAPPLHSLPSLEMLAFRCNRMVDFPRTALPQQLRWLILTDNCIEQIPDEIGMSYNFSRAEVLGVN
jgi:Leucine-rich repeat (LRR) protein